MFNPRHQENTRPDGVSVLEIVPDPDTPPDAPPRFVPLKHSAVSGTITGPLAALRLTQVYGYTRQQCDRVLEALYRFPLPGDAAVVGLRVRFGTVEIHANLKERQRAEEEYAEARRQGRQAAVLTRESPDVFTLKVAGIAPDQDVTVETEYVQLARNEGGGWSLRIPLTTSPRFVREDERSSRHAHGQPLAILRDPGHRFSLDVTLEGGGTMTSPTHRLALTPGDEGVRVRLQDGEVLPDRDCVLAWRPPAEPEHPGLQVSVHEDAASGQVYFLARVTPPSRRPAGTGPVRETIVLVDHSGSMQGAKWEAADWTVKKFLAELGERDTFDLGLFHDRTEWLGKRPQPATPEAVQNAVAFLEAHKDSGGTQLGVALEQALDRPRVKEQAARHVLIITDAEVSDAGRILRLAEEESRRPDRRRIDGLCIDAAPNAFLASELAERGGGVSKFLTSAPEELDITTALDEVLAEWAAPVFTDLRLQVDRSAVDAAGRQVVPGDRTWTAIDLGDLPAGRSVWVVGRVPRGGGDLGFRLTTAARELVSRRAVLTEGQSRPALKALFGARRVLGLEFVIHAGYSGAELADQLRRLGYDPDEVLAGVSGGKKKVYAENTREEAQTALRRLLVREALDYGLASSETALVAIRSEPGKPVEETVVVANALPAGWSDVFMGAFTGAAMMAKMPLKGVLGRGRCDRGGARAMAAPSPAAASPPAAAFGFAKTLGAVGKGASATPAAGVTSKDLFSGAPSFLGGEALLFDSSRPEDAAVLPETATFVRLRVEFPDGTPPAEGLDAGLSLLLFVDDLAAPRARVRLADLVRHGGERPLNLRREAGQVVRLVLADPAGAWAAVAPALKVSLSWT
jgi:Ca-activated chloride channel family protein